MWKVFQNTLSNIRERLILNLKLYKSDISKQSSRIHHIIQFIFIQLI